MLEARGVQGCRGGQTKSKKSGRFSWLAVATRPLQLPLSLGVRKRVRSVLFSSVSTLVQAIKVSTIRAPAYQSKIS